MFRPSLLVLAATALVAAGCGDDEANGSGEAGSAAEPAAEAAMKDKHGATIKVVDSQYGRVIADRRGEALYLFDREKGKRSRCYGKCAVAWPPVFTKGKARAGKGADANLLGTTKRRNGKLQVTYNGHPLYYFKDDEPGRILCHNVDEFGGTWLVVTPRGRAVS